MNTENKPKEISVNANKISILAPKSTPKEISPKQASLGLGIEKDTELGGIGMGVLLDGTPYLNQRGLAALCGVQNAHIGSISSQWNEAEQKPRIAAIKAVLLKAGFTAAAAHIEILHAGRTHFCYPAEISLAILEYYGFDAGTNCQIEARDNFRLLAGSKLREMIYSQVGYDPTGAKNHKFEKWHERIALNYQSAPKGFFHVFNEAHTIIYELILAGADIGAHVVVDISIGIHWSKYWIDHNLVDQFGDRTKYPHCYPDSHPQSKSNPQESWCYPLAALGSYRGWLQDVYIEGGKFNTYLKGNRCVYPRTLKGSQSVSTWIELRCGFRFGSGCYSFSNRGPSILSPDTVRLITMNMKKLRDAAAVDGWEMTDLGWSCPSCTKIAREARLAKTLS